MFGFMNFSKPRKQSQSNRGRFRSLLVEDLGKRQLMAGDLVVSDSSPAIMPYTNSPIVGQVVNVMTPQTTTTVAVGSDLNAIAVGQTTNGTIDVADNWEEQIYLLLALAVSSDASSFEQPIELSMDAVGSAGDLIEGSAGLGSPVFVVLQEGGKDDEVQPNGSGAPVDDTNHKKLAREVAKEMFKKAIEKLRPAEPAIPMRADNNGHRVGERAFDLMEKLQDIAKNGVRWKGTYFDWEMKFYPSWKPGDMQGQSLRDWNSLKDIMQGLQDGQLGISGKAEGQSNN